MPNDIVKVEISEYNKMLWKAKMFELLESAILETSRLNYNATELVFDDNAIGLLLKAVDYFGYESRFNALKGVAKDESVNNE